MVFLFFPACVRSWLPCYFFKGGGYSVNVNSNTDDDRT
jgi:hypothetical protein